MPAKSQRVDIPVTAKTLEEAIATLSHSFLRFNKSGIRVVSQATEFCVVDLCQRLIEDWRSGKVDYEAGEITLSFSNAEPNGEADLLIYKPATGDRLLYSRRQAAIPKTADKPKASTAQLELSLETDALQPILRQFHALSEVLEELTTHQRSVESRLQRLATQTQASQHATAHYTDADLSAAIYKLRDALEVQTADLAYQFSSQLTAATQSLSERLNQMQGQIDQIVGQLDLSDEPQAPQTEAEWRQRIKDTWGTVGDYEQYSVSHRELNAEAPLFSTPDWVALCELEWARKICPPLGVLHQLIHEENGIGYAGADILQQFGRHVDPRTGDRYYLYQIGGYSAYDALWKTIHHPQYSWLPELRRLSKRLTRHPEVYEMFGWQKEAIAALEQVVEQATYQQQSAHQSAYGGYAHQRAGNTLSDYLAVLNLGPFSPLTLESIKQAYKQAMKLAHPDTGGSKELAQRVNEAYEAILRHYFPNAI